MERILAPLIFLPLVCGFHWLGARLASAIFRRGNPPSPFFGSACFALSLGTWTLAPVLFLLGAAGLLNRWSAWTIYAVLAALGLSGIRGAWRAVRRDVLALRGGRGSVNRVLIFLFAALCLTQTVDAVNFPMGADQLAYHFPVARQMAQTGGIEPLYGLPPSCMLPQNPHLYIAFGMLLHSDVLGKLFTLLWAFLNYGLVHGLGAALFGRRTARLGLFIYAFTPWVVYKLHFPYAEVSLAHALLLGTLLFWAYRRGVGKRPLIAAGMALGIALGIKQTAWVLLPALAGAVWLARRRMESRPEDLFAERRPVRHQMGAQVTAQMAAALAPAVLLGSFWCWRNLYYLGDPFWPLLRIGKHLTLENLVPGYQPETASNFSFSEATAYAQSLFLNYGNDCFSFFSPFLLMLLPLLPKVLKKSKTARGLATVAGLGLIWCYFMAPFSSRYWFPFFVLLCPVLALGIRAGSHLQALRALHTAALLLAALGTSSYLAISTAHLLKASPNRETLHARLPEWEVVEQVLDRVDPDERVGYPYENYYIFPENVLPLWCNQGWINFLRGDPPAELARRLREAGIGYLIHSKERNGVFEGSGAAYEKAVAQLIEGGMATVACRVGGFDLVKIAAAAESRE